MVQQTGSLRSWLRSLRDPQKLTLHRAIADGTSGLDELDAARLERCWEFWAREKQLPPVGDWYVWVICAGRGFGKTRTGAEWFAERARAEPGSRGALVAQDFSAGRDVMVEGESGLLSLFDPAELRGGSIDRAWNRSNGELVLANDTLAKVYSSERPDKLRGPQHHYGWGDEVSSWNDASHGDAIGTTFSNLILGLRLGVNPQMVLTTTPKTNRLTRHLFKRPNAAITIGSTYENLANLAPPFRTEILQYEGTRVGRQELHAELLEDAEGALWSRALLETCRRRPPETGLPRIVVAVDPNVSESEGANEAGIIVVGYDPKNRQGYVLADVTTFGGPSKWTVQAIEAYHSWKADTIVAEKNNGGELVRIALRAVDERVPIELVTASRGKRPRAEPVATLYEQRRVFHAEPLEALEDQLASWTPDTDESPDRMDAMVWGITHLMLRSAGDAGTVPVEGDVYGREPVTVRGDLRLVGRKYVDAVRR